MAVLAVGRICYSLSNHILNNTILHHFSEIHLLRATMVTKNEVIVSLVTLRRYPSRAAVVRRAQSGNSGDPGFQPSLPKGRFPTLGSHILTFIYPDLATYLFFLNSGIVRNILLNFS